MIKRIIWTLALAMTMLAASAETDFERACANLTGVSLPQVNLTLDVDSMTKEVPIAGRIDIADPQCRTTGDTLASFDCRLHWRGATSLKYNKKSIAVKIVDSLGEERDVNMLGIREKENWILDAMAIDRMRMRNRVLFDLWNELPGTPWETDYNRRNGTLGHFVEVYFNGDYQGLYCLTDKIDRKLLDLKKAKVDTLGNVTVRGLMYKCVDHSRASYLNSYNAEAPVDTTEWNSWELKLPEDYPSLATWQPLMDIIDTCRYLEPARLKERYQDFFYRDNLIDYMLFVLAFRLTDNSLKNTYLSVPDITKDKRFIITPWDLDSSMGNTWEGNREDEVTDMKFLYAVLLYYKLYYFDPDFKQAFKDRWRELRLTTFSHENLEAKLHTYAGRLMGSGAWERERAKWNNDPVPMLDDVRDEVAIVSEWYGRNIVRMNEMLVTPWDNLAITIPAFEHGVVTADREVGAEGDIVTLTIVPDKGYRLVSLTIDDGKPYIAPAGRVKAPVACDMIDGNTYSFVMPAAPVTIDATFGVKTGVDEVAVPQGVTRYYDLGGRYVGTDFNALGRGIYLTGDGQKIKK